MIPAEKFTKIIMLSKISISVLEEYNWTGSGTWNFFKNFCRNFDSVLGEHDTRGGRPPTNF